MKMKSLILMVTALDVQANKGLQRIDDNVRINGGAQIISFILVIGVQIVHPIQNPIFTKGIVSKKVLMTKETKAVLQHR